MKKFFIFLCVLFILSPLQGQAQQDVESKRFSSVPVLFDGRMMPIDSFATILVARVSGDRYRGDAMDFLVDSLFDPSTMIEKQIFYLKDKNILALPNRDNFFYSYNEIDAALQQQQDVILSLFEQPRASLSLEQEQLLRLHDHFILYGQILRAMTGFMPIALREAPRSYFELQQLDYDVEATKNILREPEEDFSGYSAADQKAIEDFFKIEVIRKSAENNQLFRVIRSENNFIAPWEALRKAEREAAITAQLQLWQDMVRAYGAGDQGLWDETLARMTDNIPARVQAEKIYNDVSLTFLSAVLFGISILLMILYLFSKHGGILSMNAVVFSTATVFLFIDIGLRIFISARPPIGTLYESILFAAAILAICFVFFRKQPAFILTGGIGCFILMMSAKGFVGEDSFSPLVAVLNTNFWLATHVIIITAGYGLCLMTSLLAHLALYKPHKNWKRLLTHFGVASLLFVTVGTVLGGLWADQSWGRFWGWDPKENGALLIIIWLIWMVHAKMTDYIDDAIYYAGMAYLSVVVALAWFGVNLLSVGLHSYGFISGIAFGLASFCITQTLVIGLLFYRHKKYHEN